MLIRSLRAFLALHRYGTLVAAAEAVHLSQAAVSAQMKNIEQELGVELFVRTKRSIRLTPAGHRLVPLALRVVETYEEMRALGDRGAVAGTLSLGVITSALSGVLPGLLRKITLENPRLEVKVVAGNSIGLVQRVESGDLDAAIVTRPPRGFSSVSSLRVRHLYSEPFALIAHRSMGHMDLAGILAAAPFVRFDPSTWAGMQIDGYLAEHGLHVRPGLELNSLDAIAVMVGEGLGVSIVPLIRGSAWHRRPSLYIARLPDFYRPVSLVEPAAHARSPLTDTLIASFEEFDLLRRH